VAPRCGDGQCDPTESCASCQVDCTCPYELHVQAADVGPGYYATQCYPGDTSHELVWRSTVTTGCPTCSAAYSFAYTQNPAPPGYPCNASTNGIYPIVFGALPAPAVGSWVIQCTNQPGYAYIFKVTGVVDGHPVAPFQYPQPATSSCP
jgi:hypothetical protein